MSSSRDSDGPVDNTQYSIKSSFIKFIVLAQCRRWPLDVAAPILKRGAKCLNSPWRHLLKIFHIFCLYYSDLFCCWCKRKSSWTIQYFFNFYIMYNMWQVLFVQLSSTNLIFLTREWPMYLAEMPLHKLFHQKIHFCCYAPVVGEICFATFWALYIGLWLMWSQSGNRILCSQR